MEKLKKNSTVRKDVSQQVSFIVPVYNERPQLEDDTQMAGLSLRYADGGGWSTASPELKLLFCDNGYYLNKLPYQVASASDVDHNAGIGQFTIRRRSNHAVSAANQICRMYDMMLDDEVVTM